MDAARGMQPRIANAFTAISAPRQARRRLSFANDSSGGECAFEFGQRQRRQFLGPQLDQEVARGAHFRTADVCDSAVNMGKPSASRLS